MKSLFKLFSFSLAVLFMAPALVLAGPPDPTQSEVPDVWVSSLSDAVPTGVFTVVVRHVNGSPADLGTTVTISFMSGSGSAGVASPALRRPPFVRGERAPS